MMLTYFNPLTWGRWVREFAFLWLLSIPWRSVSLAIPAILVLIAIVSLTVVARSHTLNWRNELIEKQFYAAWQIDDFATAELVLRRQLTSRPDNPDLIFKLGVCRENREAHDEALQLMRQLVAVKRHEPAARWLLDKEYLKKQWNDLDERQRSEFGQLLQLIHEESPNDLVVTQLYAELLIAQNRLTTAVGLIEELAIVQPMRGLQAAAIYRRLGNEQTATRLARLTAEQVSQLAKDDPTNSTLWMAFSQCLLFLSEHSEAVSTLEQAIPLAKTPENVANLKQAVGDSIVAWIAFIEAAPSNTAEQKLQVLKMLQSALQYAPNNPRVLMLVADKVLATIDDDNESIVVARDALVAGSSPGISHFIRGTAAMMKDDIKNAELHLSIAAQHLPKSGAILNNLAVALTARPDADLDQALKISETAINHTPDASPHFYETRGQILLKMERYLDAVPDLERALAVPELAPVAHQSLARCYEKLGQEELSREHEAEGKKLLETKK
jgi:tetratricopeptide (TPR) repeat protein